MLEWKVVSPKFTHSHSPPSKYSCFNEKSRGVLGAFVAGPENKSRTQKKNHISGDCAFVVRKAHVEHLLHPVGFHIRVRLGTCERHVKQRAVDRGGSAPASSRGKCDENSPREPYLLVQETNRRDRESLCGEWPDIGKTEDSGAGFGNCRTGPDSFGRFFRRTLRLPLCLLECAAQAVQRSAHSMTEGLRS